MVLSGILRLRISYRSSYISASISSCFPLQTNLAGRLLELTKVEPQVDRAFWIILVAVSSFLEGRNLQHHACLADCGQVVVPVSSIWSGLP